MFPEESADTGRIPEMTSLDWNVDAQVIEDRDTLDVGE
jgi:hypothetical protein